MMGTITAGELASELELGSGAAEASGLAERIRARVGDAALAGGSGQFVDELDVAWAISAPEAKAVPMVVADLGADFRLPMQRLGDTGLYVAATSLMHGSAVRWRYEVAGERVGGGQTETYLIHPDGREQADVPKGRLITREPWPSRVFAGTVRDWSVYFPAQSDGPAAVMVFQDGVRHYQDFVPTVFDILRVRHALRPVCPLPAGGDSAGGRPRAPPAGRCRRARDLRDVEWRDLLIHGRLAAPRSVP
jgi:hypothetical protein